MQVNDFLIEGCSSSVALEAIPKKSFSFDLKAIAEKLESNGINLEINTPVVLIFNFNGFPVSLYKHGKIIIKNIQEEEKFKELLKKLLELIK